MSTTTDPRAAEAMGRLPHEPECKALNGPIAMDFGTAREAGMPFVWSACNCEHATVLAYVASLEQECDRWHREASNYIVLARKLKKEIAELCERCEKAERRVVELEADATLEGFRR